MNLSYKVNILAERLFFEGNIDKNRKICYTDDENENILTRTEIGQTIEYRDQNGPNNSGEKGKHTIWCIFFMEPQDIVGSKVKVWHLGIYI